MNKPIYILDGKKILTSQQFHEQIMKVIPDFPDFYGKNLDALWDVLSGFIDTNIKIIWKDHAISREAMGEHFDGIIETFRQEQRSHPHFEFELK